MVAKLIIEIIIKKSFLAVIVMEHSEDFVAWDSRWLVVVAGVVEVAVVVVVWQIGRGDAYFLFFPARLHDF